MSAEDLAGFRRAVLDDPTLQRELLATEDRKAFVLTVVALARSRGRDVRAEDVDEGLRAGRRAWQERWI